MPKKGTGKTVYHFLILLFVLTRRPFVYVVGALGLLVLIGGLIGVARE